MPVIYFVDGPADGRKEVMRGTYHTGDRWRFPIYKPIDFFKVHSDADLNCETAEYELKEIEDGVFTGLYVP